MNNSKWFGVIYIITNLLSGKQYVGKAEDWERRWRQHIQTASGKPLHAIHYAIRKHGVKNFSFDLLQRCHTLTTLNKAEMRWIKKLSTLSPKGYNLTLGGEGVSGLRFSKAALKRLRVSQQARCAKPGESEARSAARGTPESRKKASDSQKRRYANRLYKAQHREACRTADARKNYSRARKLHYASMTPKEYKVWYENFVACRQTEEYRAKLRAAQQKRFSNKKHKAAMRAAKQTSAARANYSKGAKARYAAMTSAERRSYWHKIHPHGNK